MKKYKFRSIMFFAHNQKCNCCGYNLLTNKHYSKKNGEYYEIIKCENEECLTNKDKKKTNFVLKSYIPEDVYDEEIKRRRKNNYYCIEFYLERGYSEDEANNIISKRNSCYSKLVKNRKGKSKVELRKKGYTEEQIKEICLTSANVKFWINKGFSEEESILKVKEHQSNASKHVDYTKRLTTVNLQYYINKGFNEEESKKLLKERQTTFTLNKCIEKHGLEKGTDIYNKRQKDWSEKMNIKYKNGDFSKTSSNNYSKMELEFISEVISLCELKENEYFSNLTETFFIRSKELNITLSYDFVLKNKNKVIEFNGDYWHCNPNKYVNTFVHPHKNMIAEDIWKFDEIKNNFIKNKGYEILVIWESEYKNNKENILNNCKNFLTK